MKAGRGIGALALALLALLVIPAHSAATDSDLKFAYAFKVEASHGYSIAALASNERADGRGEIVLFVRRGPEGAAYLAPAQLSATGVKADLGALGAVDLAVAPSGRKQKLRTRCGKGRAIVYEPPVYSGTFQFHGEEGYTDGVSASPRDFTRFFSSILCSEALAGETRGAGLPGARLSLRGSQGGSRFHLRVNENHPGARARFEIETSEKRGSIRISRESTAWLPSSAFHFDPTLRTATLAPASPFAGHATFHRDAAPANRWSGNLTVDLPGRSNLPLTGPGLTATLAHACFQREGAGTRVDCGFR
jgi:hypothetical protein